MEHSILFNGSPQHGDVEYLEWLENNSNGFVANIAHPHTKFDNFIQVVLHWASCPRAQQRGRNGHLTSHTQWKICSPDLETVKHGAQRYTTKELHPCEFCKDHLHQP